MLHEMEGTTWQPVPGHKSDHVPVEIHPDGTPSSRANEDDDSVKYEVIPIEEDSGKTPYRVVARTTDIRVTHKDVEQHGATPGCPACGYLLEDKKIPRGVGHSVVCRKRIRELVELDEDTRDRVERANQRKERKESVVSYVEDKSSRSKCRRGKALPPNMGTSKSLPTQPKHIAKLQKEMQVQMMQLVAEEIDVAEIYSPPRVTQRARQWGLKPGWSLDITTKDENGDPWDFSRSKMRRKAINKINEDRPLLVVGSPMCTDWTTMIN